MTVKTEGSAPAVQWFDVEADCSGQRIDNYLMSRLKGAPRTLIYRKLRKGEIRVNKGRIKPDYRVQNGDRIRVPPMRLPEPGQPAKASNSLAQTLESAVLFENDELIIINKPSGLAVHGGSGVSLGMIEALRQIRPQAHFLELVHRLDRDTSGCVMVAKQRSTLRGLHEALRNGKVTKIYYALVHGEWSKRKLKVDAPLKKNELKSGERMVKVSGDGKVSLTEYRVLRRFNDCTLVEAKPITGRTHQIRVHCQFAGHPILGDAKYGEDAANSAMRQQGLRRLFLHAAELKVRLPKTGQQITVSAPLEKPLLQLLNQLGSVVSYD